MSDDKLIKVVENAILAEQGESEELARTVIEAVRAYDAEASMVLVPRVPSEMMILEGRHIIYRDGGAGIAKTRMARAYAAMLMAHERSESVQDLSSIDNAEIAEGGE